MASLAEESDRHVNQGTVLLPIVFFLSPLATSVAPRLTPFVFAIVAISLIGAGSRRGMRWWELLPRTSAFVACLLLAAYVFVNAAWSADPVAAFGKAALLTALIILSFAAVKAAQALDRRTLFRAALSFTAGAFAGAVFLLVELLTDGIVTRTVFNYLPFLHSSSPKHVHIEHGKVTHLNLSKLDQNANMLMFHLWPGLLGLMGLEGARRPAYMLLFFVTLGAAIAISNHDSSKVALIGSSLVVLMAWNWRRSVIRALAVLWCAAFVLVIPASFIAYQSGLQFAPWLSDSNRARIILWEYTAEQALSHPLLGIGVESTPVLSAEQKATREQPEGFVFPRTTGHHAHNIFLHAWFELGAAGAILLAIAGVAVVLLIPSLPVAAQPFGCGVFAAFGLVGAFAWGMWQSWFMCAVGLAALYLCAATVPISTSEAPRDEPDKLLESRMTGRQAPL